MPCSVTDNTFNPTSIPATPLPGFGIPFSPINPEYPGIALPNTGAIENLLDLVNNIQAIVPSGIFHLNPNEFSKTVMDAVAGVFDQFAPFLSLYNFFSALLNIIVCIIEVLCAIPNPFKMIKAVRKLFAQCLPPFLALFPIFALPIIILSFLLLLLALIEYLIVTFLKIIEDITNNLARLSEATRDQNNDAINAITKKISFLICQIENLFAIITAIAAIISIIQSLSKLATGTICNDQSTDGCCGPDICPLFISQNPNGITGSFGKLIYQSQADPNLSIFNAIPGFNANNFNFQPLRNERWQFLDTNQSQFFSFIDMVTPIEGNIFFPEGVVFNKNTNANKAPYTLDLTFSFNPENLHSLDIKGFRQFYIKDCIILTKPTNQIVNFNNTYSSHQFGTVFIEGGLVFESDKITPYLINGTQATLNTFVHKDSTIGISNSDDSIIFENVEFLWKINHQALVGYTLITLGCVPEISQEKFIQNAIISAQSVLSTLVLPDLNASQNCLQQALTKFKQNISSENVAIFQAEILSCLNDLKQQSLESFLQGFLLGFNQFKSEITLTPSKQFITRKIIVSVIIKDTSGINMAINLPVNLQQKIAQHIEGFQSFGNLSKFLFNPTTFSFDAELTSKIIGKGTISVDFNNQTLSTIINGDVNNFTQIKEQILDYEFIKLDFDKNSVRYNEIDVANA